MQFSIFVISGLLAGVLAAPASRDYVVHERRERRPQSWYKSAMLNEDSYIPLRIGLTQNNLHRADEYLMDVSDPDSPNYGKHWSAKQIAETFAPSKESLSAVIDWLAEHGISGSRVKQSQSLTWIHANVTTAEAEKLLRTKYYQFTHAETGQSHIACEEYSLPNDIQEHIDIITPTVHFDVKVKKNKKHRQLNEAEIDIVKRQIAAAGHHVQPGTRSGIGLPSDKSLPKYGGKVSSDMVLDELRNCDRSIVPNCLRVLYQFPQYFPASPNNSHGIVEYTPQAYVPSDLDLFFRNFSKKQVGDRPIFNSIDGGFLYMDEQSFNFNAESNLDLEYAMSLVYPQKVTLYQVGDIVQGASFNNFLDAIDGSYCTYMGGDDPLQDATYPDLYPNPGAYTGPANCGGFAATNVISTSYGYNEADLTPAYEMRQCYEYMKLGLQGVSFLYSSGDYGVAGNGGQCIDVNGNYNNGSSGRFNPSFPSTCPYVTSVGATQIAPGASVTQPEQAAESVIYSGGGFSNVFPLPSYQAGAVSDFFASTNKPLYNLPLYNNSQKARGYPDVSANGVNYVIAVNGNFSYVYGTSASAPTFGSVLTLVNSVRLSVGKNPVGFVNPVAYKFPGMFNDVTEGGNRGCGTPGFQAGAGWDPVTGLGTPNFPRMVATWLRLP